ncbi:hypothetical protein FACS1894174_05280 [Bacteroidia bacterium]|nr:hypothetical protein FACS1894203_1990 [Bacteroidia bacterium]GHU89712.1 hypothetical protein FACS1894155_07130 [Bacteroidia bacterium]GHV21621.1 hypothetical protein FACS1894174_05280 [Bacteroidia bacterium]
MEGKSEKENKKDKAIDFFKAKILEIFKPVKILHIGSNCVVKNQNNEYDYERDIDLIIIVNDTVDYYEYIKQFSLVLKDAMVRYDVEINAYPIKESIYQHGESEFLTNVRNNAIEIWKN